MSARVISGRYRLDSLLGQGSMGQVWRAHDDRLDRDVAVKLVASSAAAAGHDTAVARFRREVVATARLDHPNIVSVFDAGTDGDTAYLVMELLGGRSVAQLLDESSPLPLDRALAIGRDVAAALTAAHAAGLVHRDIKPANVMVSPQGRVKVLDFGIAHLAGAESTLTEPDTAIGTAAYMAPEQAAGATVGPEADAYALGCLLTTMVTGSPPFSGENAIAVATQQISAPPPRLSSRTQVPQALDDLVTRLLAKDPAERPGVAQVEQRLAAIAADPGPLTGPAGAVAAVPATMVLPSPPRTAAPAQAPRATALLPATGGPATPLAPSPARPAPTPPNAPRKRRGWAVPVVLLVLLLVGLLAFWYAYSLAGTTAVPLLPTPSPTSAAASSRAATPSASRTTSRPRSSTRSSAAPTRATSAPQTPTAGSTLAVTAAVRAVTAALDQLPDGKAKSKLHDEWEDAAPDIIAGKDADERLDGFRDTVIEQQREGELATGDALMLLAAVEGVRAVV